MKKVAVMSIILLIILINASCGKNQQKVKSLPKVTVTQTMYKAKRIKLPGDVISLKGIVYSESNGVRIVYQNTDGALNIADFDEKMNITSSSEIVPEREADEFIVNSESDGSFTLLCIYNDFENEKVEFEIRLYNAEGKYLKSVNVSGIEPHFTMGKSYAVDIVRYANGYILAFNDGIVQLDENGSVIDAAETESGCFYGEDSEGNMIVSMKKGYMILDGEGIQMTQEAIPYGGSLYCVGGHFRGTDGFRLYFMMNDGIYGLTESDDLVKISDYIASGINGSEIFQAAPAGDGRFVALGRDKKNMESYLLLLKVRPDNYVQDKETVVVGVSGDINSEKRELSVDFNKFSDDYSVELKAYDENDEKLKEDVLSGNAPDVYCYSDIGTMYRYANMGAFADMWELSEKYGGFCRDDILENIVSAYEYKGGLYGISDSFSANFLIANSEVISEEYSGWNYDEFLNIAENLPEDMYLGVERECSSPEDVFELYCLRNLSSWIDYERAVCSFDSDEFIRLLEFTKTVKTVEPFDFEEYAVTHSQEERDLLINEIYHSVKNKKSLLVTQNFGSLADLSYIADMYGFKDGEMTFLNYPSSNRSGTVAPNRCSVYSVLSNGKCTAGGWEFVDYIMSYENQANKSAVNSSRCFSTRKDAFEDNLRHDQYISANPDVTIDGEECHNFEFLQYGEVSDETLDSIKKLVGRCNVLSGENKAVENIMRDEFLKFMNDEITAEECSERIQKMIEIYLSETS